MLPADISASTDPGLCGAWSRSPMPGIGQLHRIGGPNGRPLSSGGFPVGVSAIEFTATDAGEHRRLQLYHHRKRYCPAHNPMPEHHRPVG